tara:strand:- start:472 stop:684 length:213 start_codon:yes stop_codon:yes gene_type:complete
MSVVGPRPVMIISFEAYPKEIKKVIYNVKPGLTAWVIFFLIQSFMKNGLKIYQSEIFNNNLKRKVKDYEL